MAKYTIGIDFGSLSARAVLINVENGEQIALSTSEYTHGVMDTILTPTGEKLPPNFALQHPNDYLSSLKEVVNEIMQKSKVNPEDVFALGIDFTSCTILPIKSDGTPLCALKEFSGEKHAYVKLWKHHSAQPYADILNSVAKERKEDFLDYCGGVVSSESLFSKIYEVLDCAPNVYQNTDYFVEAGDWVNFILTDKLALSYCFAVYKGFYVQDKGFPCEEFFTRCDKRLQGVKNKICNKILKLGEPVGKITLGMAKELGLSPNTIISSCIIDAHASGCALNLKENGDTFGVMGTSACFMSISDKKAVVKGTCGFAKDGIVPNFYGYEAGLCCFGDCFSYVADNLAGVEYHLQAQKEGVSVLNLLMKKAEKIGAGKCGLLALNWLNGNRSILVDSDLSGMFLGVKLTTLPEDYIRALMEATAFGTRNIIENYLKYGIKINKFIATGGIPNKNSSLMQILADVLGMNIYISSANESGALGSAINAAVSCGIYKDFISAQENMSAGYSRVYYPNPENKRIYDLLYAEYKKLHDYFGLENDVMKKLTQIKRINN